MARFRSRVICGLLCAVRGNEKGIKMTPFCAEHTAFKERFGRIDERLREHDRKVDSLTKIATTQAAVLASQAETNKRLEDNLRCMREEFATKDRDAEERIRAIEQQPKHYWDKAIGAIIVGLVGFVMWQIGLGGM